MKRKQLRKYDCWKANCNAFFPSWQQRDAHIAEEHKPPQKTVQAVLRFGEHHSLSGGSRFSVGDPISFSKRGIITKITRTEGSNDVEIEIAVVKDFYTAV